MNYIKVIEKIYLRNQKEKILDFWRELYKTWEINLEQLKETYFYCNMLKNK